ncbi:right-handed parallel beta-helix repeat-containing protein [Cerasicoccus fimbriatus]|uniref:right-handed parallel beta-helix repeat-containing protein n=1 Tax=Cerasicoccus fimbriatus TaxID=3014554 RepID=UPI0022B3FA5B|nr:right-handed parallel beta-helix repeat-containing protein [Cerasicoccus sp. TK19100]
MTQITVGPSNADIVTREGAGIQRAIDQVAGQGGGVVVVQPGEYSLCNAVSLAPGVHLKGASGETIFRRAPLVVSKLVCDADRGQRVIYPHNPERFRVGMGVGLYDRKGQWTKTSTPWGVTAVHDDRIEIHRIMGEERYEESDAAVVNYYPMILAKNADRCVIEGIVCDGSVRFEHELSHGIEREIAEAFADPPPYFSDRVRPPRTSLIFGQQSRHCELRNLRAHHGAGDGICWSFGSEHALIDSCETDHNGWYGIHPGSHSAYAKITRCHIHHNASDGLYICWGIHHSEFTHNDIHDNGMAHWRSGISIGHKDSDNLIAHNRIANNAKYGICIRSKTPQNAPHRCRYLNNVLEDNATPPDVLKELKDLLHAEENVAAQISIGANVTGLEFRENSFIETRPGMTGEVLAFHAHPDAGAYVEAGNSLSGVKLR